MLQSTCLTIAPGEGAPPLQSEVYIRLIHDLYEPPAGRFAARTSAHGFVLMLRGQGRLSVDAASRAMARADCVRYAPGMRLYWEGGRGTHLLRCTVKGTRAGAMLDAIDLQPGLLRRAPSTLCQRLAAEVHRLRSQGAGTWDAVSLAWIFFAAWAPPASADADPVDACVELMQERYGEGLAIEQLACELSIDRSTLFRRFRERYGCSPKQWFDEYRLERAAELLQSGASAVQDIARACGFDDPAWFGRRFRQRYGCPPGDFSARQGSSARPKPRSGRGG